MAQDFADDHDDPPLLTDADVARIVLELDREIMLSRRAAALHQIVQGQPVPLPVKPSRIELAVLTTLAQTYGWALRRHDFRRVREALAECGAVVLVQRVLFEDAWGDRSDDVRENVRLAARLLAARLPFEILCGTWPEVFMAQALAELRRFRPQPPGSSAGIDHGGGDDD